MAGGWITALKIFGANLFACNQGGGLYISKNNGASWARTDSGIASGAPVTTLANGGSYLFAGAYGSGIYRSGNGGASWTRINSGFSDPLLRIRTMAVIDTNLFVGVDVYGVLRFTSDGTSWVYANQGLSNGNIRSLVVSDSSLFGGSYDGGGVFLSVNEGASWTSVSSGWPSQGLQSYDLALAVLGSNLFAGTGWGGVWRRPLSEMVASVMTSRTGLPVEYSLQQNYPNPFNPVTTIRYDLPTSSLVRLSVFDILGREVYVLVNEVKKAGSYEVKFDGSNLASGVYLCRMQTGSFIQARKLLLLR